MHPFDGEYTQHQEIFGKQQLIGKYLMMAAVIHRVKQQLLHTA
jgi:hypothetical protein